MGECECYLSPQHRECGAYCGKMSQTGFPSLAIVQQHPIVDTIIFLSDILENLGEQLAKEVVVGSLLESQLPHIVHVNGKLLCKE